MDADDLAAMLEGEGEEVAFDFASQPPRSQDPTMEMDMDPDEFVGTQSSINPNDSSKVCPVHPTFHRADSLTPFQDFHPLFED